MGRVHLLSLFGKIAMRTGKKLSDSFTKAEKHVASFVYTCIWI